ncbi:hypothetical protein [Devosia sp. A16]|uniref:hypothetical protein n=1 Tax=Devosia sp. A16 TaxID=1736675 RepID=UPI0018D0BB3F|nr:hypothetical protein [Devosia sp. A16]
MIDERIALDLDNMKQAAAEAISFVSGNHQRGLSERQGAADGVRDVLDHHR